MKWWRVGGGGGGGSLLKRAAASYTSSCSYQTIQAIPREHTGHRLAVKERAQGRIPAVFIDPVDRSSRKQILTADAKQIKNLLSSPYEVHKNEETGKILNMVMTWANEGAEMKVLVPVVYKGVNVCPGLKNLSSHILLHQNQREMTNLNLLLFHARRRAAIINPSQTLAFVRSICSLSSPPSSSILRPWTLDNARFVKDAPSLKLASLFVGYKEFCTYEPSSEGLIPPELLKSATVLTATDRTIGEYADLVTRVTNFQNEDKGLMVLAGDVFDVPIRKDIIHRVVRWQLAKRQQGTHSTKTLSEVSGTGKKPYRQKGTGRARHGTLRGPQFRGGCAMHGPKPRSHAMKLNKKVRRLGLKIALSARAAEGKLLVFEDLELANHKTKNIVNYVSQMDAKKVLLVDGGPINDNLKLATGNLHYVNVLPSIGLNVYSILQHDTLVMTRDAVDRIVTRMHTPIKR